MSIEINPAPQGLTYEFTQIFTPEAQNFLVNLVSTFQLRANEIERWRKIRKLEMDSSDSLPDFKSSFQLEIPKDWKISPLPPKLENRHLDLGDVSPSDSLHFKNALKSRVQGIQVDFDDGHCPSWPNMISGIHNVIQVSRNKFFPSEVPNIASCPILMLRPRAWNMVEHNVLINGKEIPGPLMDFGLLMFHTAHVLMGVGGGPYFYLSKIEGASEARLWNDIFIWTQTMLNIPIGTIKACVLIENILSAFEMEWILYELRLHSLGLNCGIWDYAASIINKFGERKKFLIPDRNKYVNMEKNFLSSYMKLVVKTCHAHGAPATGGMAAQTLVGLTNENERKLVMEKVCKLKLREIMSGVDGFMVYDPSLVPIVNELWTRYGSSFGPNQIHSVLHSNLNISAFDLLDIPKGGVTTQGLEQNIKIGILFIYAWIGEGRGHFILDGVVEDSATAEISRSQVWQWILHQTGLEDGTHEKVSRSLVQRVAWDFYDSSFNNSQKYNLDILRECVWIFLEVVTAAEFPNFITTFLYNHSTFRKYQLT